jgi:hypothetical protein
LTKTNRLTSTGVFSRREVWRLFSLLLGAAAVAFLIRELNKPQVGQRVDAAMAAVIQVQAPVRVKAETPEQQQPADPAQFQKLLELAGWDAKRWQTFAGDGPLSTAQRDELAELIWRLNTFDGPQLRAWAQTTSQRQPGELGELKGRVTRVERRELPEKLAARLEMPSIYDCRISLTGGGEATVLTARVPVAWFEMEKLDEPVAVTAVFIKSIRDSGGEASDLFVSADVAWHPNRPQRPHVSFGEAVLGDLGVDVGLLDTVRQRQPFSSRETEAFYKVLDAAGRIGANQLSRFARRDLPSVSERWKQKETETQESLSADPASATPAEKMQLQLAGEVQSRAADGRFSVAPLFNEPQRHVGELVELVGTVRRATRIDIVSAADANANSLAQQFGINHYYELDLFTDDSQNNPVVFCVRELPPGFPLGDRLHESVRIAGFFLKSWSFESRRAMRPAEDEREQTPANLRQFAPLLIGRAPIMLEVAVPEASPTASYVAAALFLLLLAAVWSAGWWFARDERRLRSQMLASRLAVPEGESLDDLDFDLSPAPPKNE